MLEVALIASGSWKTPSCSLSAGGRLEQGDAEWPNAGGRLEQGDAEWPNAGGRLEQHGDAEWPNTGDRLEQHGMLCDPTPEGQADHTAGGSAVMNKQKKT